MTTTTPSTTELLQRAARRAVRAPSIHNTQPWKLVLTGDALEIRADRSRQLPVLDPRGRQLTISLGCAVFHARVAIAAAGFEPLVHRFPDPRRRDVAARISVGQPVASSGWTSLDLAIDHRRTNRRTYVGDPVPPRVVAELVTTVRAEGSALVPITSAADRALVAELTQLADGCERGDPAYLAELAHWTTDDPRRADGVQAASVPFIPFSAGAGSPGADQLPVRGFDVRGMGWLPVDRGSGADECLLLFCAEEDSDRAWLRAGEAVEHAWLRLTDLGYWASPLTQLIEVRPTNERLCAELGLRVGLQPQVLLRVGHAPETVPTRRRVASDVIMYPNARAGG